MKHYFLHLLIIISLVSNCLATKDDSQTALRGLLLRCKFYGKLSDLILSKNNTSDSSKKEDITFKQMHEQIRNQIQRIRSSQEINS